MSTLIKRGEELGKNNQVSTQRAVGEQRALCSYEIYRSSLYYQSTHDLTNGSICPVMALYFIFTHDVIRASIV